MKDRPLLVLFIGYFIALFLILALSGLAIRCNAQKIELKKYIVPASLMFVAGGFEGAMDGLQFHYDKPNQFWNPNLSWTNKYKNNDPLQGKTFRGKYMVFTTDGWHLMKFGRNAFTMGAIVTAIGEKRKWWMYIVEGVGYWGINRLGFNLIYNKY